MSRGQHQVAVWSAASSFFATIGAIGAINILDPNDRLRFVSAVFVGIITGLAVYTRERLSEAKNEPDKYAGNLVVKDVGDKKVYSLELEGDPEELEKKNEVVFKVTKPK